MNRAIIVWGVLAAVASASCTKSEEDSSVAVVTVLPAASMPPVMQLRTVVSNAGASDTELFPAVAGATPIQFNAVFALRFSKSRSGMLDILVEALDASSQVVARGTGSVAIVAGGRAEISIQLTLSVDSDAAVPDAGIDGNTGGADTRGLGGVISTGGIGGGGHGGGATTTVPTGGAGGVSTTVPTGGAGGVSTTVPTGGAGGVSTTVPTGGTGGAPPPFTIPAGCGDGQQVPPEQCDDGNTMPFDGCSSDCRLEPSCKASGPCTSRCGDGLVVGEECDDGNNLGGDGCSPTCTIETGFTCSQPPLRDTVAVPVVYRDFRFASPASPNDFQNGVVGSATASVGIVQNELDADGKPVFTGLTGGAIHIASKESFATWYRNTEGMNHATVSKMRLWNSGAGAFVNRYGANGEKWLNLVTAYLCGSELDARVDADGKPIPCTSKYGAVDCDKMRADGMELYRCITSPTGLYSGLFIVSKVDGNPVFFPVDGDSFTPATELTYAQIPPSYDPSATWPRDVDADGNAIQHNFSFTTEIRYWFKYEADKTYQLDIVGDDDVWVFVNRRLAVDLGGIHMPASGSVTLDSTNAASLGLAPGNVYEVAVFQAERQTTGSTFKITLAGFNTAPSTCRRN